MANKSIWWHQQTHQRYKVLIGWPEDMLSSISFRFNRCFTTQRYIRIPVRLTLLEYKTRTPKKHMQGLMLPLRQRKLKTVPKVKGHWGYIKFWVRSNFQQGMHNNHRFIWTWGQKEYASNILRLPTKEFAVPKAIKRHETEHLKQQGRVVELRQHTSRNQFNIWIPNVGK